MSDETASGGLPHRPPVAPDHDRGSRVLAIDETDADAVFDALASQTARDILTALHEEPQPPSELATAADTTVQNVRYHLEKFEAAGLVEVVDTWYSSRGMEMDVYAPSDEGLVLYAGDGQTEDDASVREGVRDLLGGVAVLGLLSVVVDRVVRELVPTVFGSGPSRPTEAPELGDEPFMLSVDGAVLEVAGVTVPPGAVFLVGGLVVLCAFTAWRLVR